LYGFSRDFFRMDGTRNLSISNDIHKAYGEVDGKGTKTAVATAVNLGTYSVDIYLPQSCSVPITPSCLSSRTGTVEISF
jgi:serine protease inhibitor